MPLRVLIAGAGLGGLTLAHGLRQAGLDVALFERAPAHVNLSSSYRIHIDADGARALHTCLPADVWQMFECHSACSPRGIAFATERLAQLAFMPETARSYPISRAGLHQLLLSGLEDAVTFDSRAVGYQESANGCVTLHLADGSTAQGDVLVGADGAASAVRKQLLPHARVVDTGFVGVAGKVYLSERTRELIGTQLLSQMTLVLPRRNVAMFMAPFVRSTEATQLDLPEHLFWTAVGRPSALGLHSAVQSHQPEELRTAVLRIVAGWHPLLHALVRETQPETLIGVPLHTSQPVGAWPTTRATLLGDAVHTMTPLQGLGGNTALRDAALLCQHLVDADRGRVELLTAIGRYEAEMRTYGFAAVQRSLQMSNAVASSNALGRLAFRTLLRATTTVPGLRARLFGRSAHGR